MASADFENGVEAHGPAHTTSGIDDLFPVTNRNPNAFLSLDANRHLVWGPASTHQNDLLTVDANGNLVWLSGSTHKNDLLAIDPSGDMEWLPGSVNPSDLLGINPSGNAAWFTAGAAQSLLSMNGTPALAWFAAGAAESIFTLDGSGHLAWFPKASVPSFLWTDAGGNLGWFAKDEVIGAVASAGYQLPSNDVTMRDVTGALMTLPANSSWHFTGVVKYESSATAKFKFQFTIPAGAQLRFSSMQFLDNTGAPTFVQGAPDLTPVLCQGNGTNLAIEISGVITIAGTAGSLQLQAAQNVATVETSDFVSAGTCLIGKRVL